MSHQGEQIVASQRPALLAGHPWRERDPLVLPAGPRQRLLRGLLRVFLGGVLIGVALGLTLGLALGGVLIGVALGLTLGLTLGGVPMAQLAVQP
jgi:predicted lipid-binding transport protein (Tim44 family)